jgi:hypothetical protein
MFHDKNMLNFALKNLDRRRKIKANMSKQRVKITGLNFQRDHDMGTM